MIGPRLAKRRYHLEGSGLSAGVRHFAYEPAPYQSTVTTGSSPTTHAS